jgi:Uma2 family endonuclease
MYTNLAYLPEMAPPRSHKKNLPTMYDLPSEDQDDLGVPDLFHSHQPHLLGETFGPPFYSPEQICVAPDLNLYYDVSHPTWYKRPDWFVALVPRLYEGHDMRMSYVIWQEKEPPFLVVELLSEGTEKEDLGQTVREIKQPPTKWEVYERILRIPYYVVFSRSMETFRAFQLGGRRYRELEVEEDQLWFLEINLGLGVWDGVYEGFERKWLRWYDGNGEWIPTYSERIEQERLRAEQERQRAERGKWRAEQERLRAERGERRAEQERQRAEQLAAQLRALGIEPNV